MPEEAKKGGHKFLRRGTGSGSGSRSPNKNVSPNRAVIRPTSKGKVAAEAAKALVAFAKVPLPIIKAPEVKLDAN